MYVIKDENDKFVSFIRNNEIQTTVNLSLAMIFKDLDTAKACLDYLLLENINEDYAIFLIKFEEVE